MKAKQSSLAGCRILITAGPTREAIDPVRFISNRSSGKMGYAVARAAMEAKAQVCLVSGPVALESPDGVDRVNVESAKEMLQVVLDRVEDADVFIAAAAVADYVPKEVATHKIKKNDREMTLELTRAPDILATVGSLEGRPFCVGFAAETHELERFAVSKLERKNANMIAANKVGDGRAFDSDTNTLTVYWRGGSVKIMKDDKVIVAKKLIDLIADRYASYKKEYL